MSDDVRAFLKSDAAEPGAGAVHVPQPLGKKRGEKTPNFLNRFYARLREMFADKDAITRDDLEAAFRHARGAAGGMAYPAKPQASEDAMVCTQCGAAITEDMDECPECGVALDDEPAQQAGETTITIDGADINARVLANQIATTTGTARIAMATPYTQMADTVSAPPIQSPPFAASDLADIAASGHGYRLFQRLQFAEAPEWIPYLPKPGSYTHPRYGEIVITRERNARFVANFSAGVYQDRLPIDAEHETKLSGAVGWVTALRQNSDGGVDARVDWTDRGRNFFANDRFRFFSPEWYDLWLKPETGEQVRDVAIGGALTTRPFFKPPALRALYASEAGLSIDDIEPSNQGDTMAEEQSFAEISAQLEALRAENAALKQAGEAAQVQSTQLAEQLARMAAEQQQQRFTALIRNDGARWFGENATHLDILGTLAKAFGEESAQFAAYVTQQRAVATALRTSAAFNELGQDGNGTGPESAAQKLERLAAERAKAKNIPHAVAYTEVLSENPDLYTQHVNAV